MNDQAAVTKRDLMDQNIDKVFDGGFAADKHPEITQDVSPVAVARTVMPMRPEFGVDEREADAAKMMSMCGPLIPSWLRGNIGPCWGMIQLSKRWTRFDPKTNSWVHFDPLTIAQASYLVESRERGESVGFMSIFYRALIEAFAPLQRRIRYTWEGIGETRTCTVAGLLTGETEPHVLTTPAFSIITPKKSPLWGTNPDLQLAYYGSRNWGRLYAAAVLQGVYDPEEIEGEIVSGPGVDHVKAVEQASAALHKRLAERAASNGDQPVEGFRPDAVERGMVAEEDATQTAREGRGRGSKAKGRLTKAELKKQTDKATTKANRAVEASIKAENERRAAEKQTKAKAEARTQNLTNPRHLPSAKSVKAAADRAEARSKPAAEPEPALPTNVTSYRTHVLRWLQKYDTEQALMEHWRGEKKLRDQCGVAYEDRDAVQALLQQRILAVRG